VGGNWSAAVLVDNEALCSGFTSNPARSVMPHLPGTQGSVEREKLYTWKQLRLITSIANWPTLLSHGFNYLRDKVLFD